MTDYEKIKRNKHLLIDVRSTPEFEMCRLPQSVNIPFTDITSSKHLETVRNILSAEEVENKDTGM